jgi:dihydrolipoamide dehydrogenase
MAEKRFDLLVVGGGPGGYTSAIRAAQLKMRTALVERDRLGGICLNWGCVPTKALLRNAEVLQTFRNAAEWGISCENLRLDFGAVIKRSRGIADRVSKGVEYLMKKNAIEVLGGSARLLSKETVEVQSPGRETQTIQAKHIILATGARSRTLPGVTIDRKRILSSTEAMILPSLPGSMVIVGAGAIGIEFAYFYATLGTKVTVLEMMPGILPLEDRELTRLLETSLKKRGVEILTRAKVEDLKSGPDGVEVRVLEEGSTPRVIHAELALVAIGVQGNVEHLGLEALGVVVEQGRIKVDRDYRTSVPGVYAIGDVIGPPWLAHVASAEALHCVEAIAGMSPEPIDYSSIPACTYSQPQLASVGLTEDAARAGGHELKIGKCPFRPLGKAMAIGESEGMVKLLFDARYGELLGAHILGSEATEMIAELVVAKRLGTTGKDLARAVHAHPTLSEAVMEAAASAYNEAINL